MKKICIGVVLCGILSVTAAGCGRTSEPITQTGIYFDTLIQVTIYDASKENVLDACMDLAAYYDNLWSPETEGSDIWNINHSNGQPTEVSEETAAILADALRICDATDGLLDITIQGVSDLWGFGSADTAAAEEAQENAGDATVSRIPDEKTLAKALSHVDYHALSIEGNVVTLSDADACVGLGFLAKGYIADQMKILLREQGIESAIINLGGDLVAVGAKPDGSAFRFGIQKPFDDQGSAITSLSVTDRALVSSGVYERCFYEDDVLYHHILDTSTGYPVQNNLFSVTIEADSGETADALSTLCMILGAEDGMALVDSLDGIEGVFVTEDYELLYSEGLRE